MPDGPLSNPWEAEPGEGALDTPALETPALETVAVEDSEELGAPKKDGWFRPDPKDVEIKPRPRICKQVGPRCWAAALASWRNARGFYPVDGDKSTKSPPPDIPFDPHGLFFLERFSQYALPDGSLDPANWWRFASENGMNWVEGRAGWPRPVSIPVLGELLRTKGHLYVAHTQDGADWGHVVVLWATLMRTVKVTPPDRVAPPQRVAIFMDPQIGQANLVWTARELRGMGDHYFWIGYGGGNGTREDFPDVVVAPPEGSETFPIKP